MRSLKNQYPRINAHLHNFWPAAGTWNRFHNVYMTQLMQDLKPALRPLGYTANIKEPLQIRRLDAVPLRPQADVIIYTISARANSSAAAH
ncbi:MAG: hypothetical protein HXY40_14305 [Chloroflexi bacterium]|nr:hypothetical protein [Chloroflexota bacterium]